MLDSSMVAATVRRAAEDADRSERRFVLHQVPWSVYVALRDALDDAANGGVRKKAHRHSRPAVGITKWSKYWKLESWRPD